MSPQLVGILAAIFAEQARVVAMSAENLVRINQGHALAYGEAQFFASAATLDDLSIQARNCLQ